MVSRNSSAETAPGCARPSLPCSGPEPSSAAVAAWCDAHPFEFDELVVAKATPEAVKRWHEGHLSHVGSTTRRPSSAPSIGAGVTVPAELKVAVDPTIVKRISRLVRVDQTSFRCSSESQPQAPWPSLRAKFDTPSERLHEMLERLGQALNMAELGETLCRDVPKLLGAKSCSLYLKHSHSDQMMMFTASGPSEVENNPAIAEMLRNNCSVIERESMTEPSEGNETEPSPEYSIAISGKDGERTAVLCIQGKPNSVAMPFPVESKQIIATVIPFVNLFIRNAQMFEQAVLEARWSNVLLTLARNLFEHIDSLDAVVTRIMVNAATLLACEKCSVFMVDHDTNELYSRVFDVSSNTDFKKIKETASTEIRFPMHRGIAGHVATTGKPLNIADAYDDSRFNDEVDKMTGFKTTTILCMPIFGQANELVGVAQLINKMEGGPFTPRDETLFEGFAVYCGLSIAATSMYEEAKKSECRQKVALEVLSYQVRACPDITNELSHATVPTASQLGLTSFDFDVKTLVPQQLMLAILRMFADMGFIHEYRIPYRTLCRWISSVRKNYRQVTYHNWQHAFGVTQTFFAMAHNGNLGKHLSRLELFALLIATICHDLDHRGTNNSFEGLKQSELAKLYDTSTMERHHFDMCVMILNVDENNILANLTVEEYKEVIKIVEKAILSTDISFYLKNRKNYTNLIDAGSFDWNDDGHRDLFRSMVMTAADLSAIAKPWSVQHHIAEIVYQEFFEQGDKEREIGHTPAELFDGSKAGKLPKMQLGFIDFICNPVYVALAEHVPAFRPLLDNVEENRRQWELLGQSGQYRMSTITAPLPKVDESKNSVLLKNLQVSGIAHPAEGDARLKQSQASQASRPVPTASTRDRADINESTSSDTMGTDAYDRGTKNENTQEKKKKKSRACALM